MGESHKFIEKMENEVSPNKINVPTGEIKVSYGKCLKCRAELTYIESKMNSLYCGLCRK